MAIMQKTQQEERGARLVIFGCIAVAALLLLGSVHTRSRQAHNENAEARIKTAGVASRNCSESWQNWGRENPEKMLQILR